MTAQGPKITGVIQDPKGDLVFTLTPVPMIPPGKFTPIEFKLITIRPAPEVFAMGKRLEWELSYMAIHGLEDERDLMRHLSEEKMSFYDMLAESP